MKRLLLLAVASLFLLFFVLTGCQSGGVAQDAYDKLKSQYDEISDKYQKLLGENEDIQPEIPDQSEELEAALAENADLKEQIDDLIDKYVLEGSTPAETAEKIVKYYHETHVYDSTDMFVCADMAAEVWNMLKAQGISAFIMVGDLDRPITDITKCDHSWVLAEVAPGEYLALEATGGRVVLRSENSQYYRGWVFETPAAEKEWQRLAKEYNIRVEIVNEIINEVNKAEIEYEYAVDIFNQMVSEGLGDIQLQDQEKKIDRWRVVKDKLTEIKESMEEELYNIQDQMEALATPML